MPFTVERVLYRGSTFEEGKLFVVVGRVLFHMGSGQWSDECVLDYVLLGRACAVCCLEGRARFQTATNT